VPTKIELPDPLVGRDGLVLRRWRAEDAAALTEAVIESAEHLRPWMAWMVEEPLPPDVRRRRINEWNRDYEQGGDAVLGVFLDGRVVGGCGLHRRLGEDGLEIGYWIHPEFTRRGLATQIAELLTHVAFAQPDITQVEIHHDKGNAASAGVPRKLGFDLVGEVAREPTAPADVGIECRWRMTKSAWADAARTTSWAG
jgi:RimJ/RimL family protein N-acetyltransferase